MKASEFAREVAELENKVYHNGISFKDYEAKLRDIRYQLIDDYLLLCGFEWNEEEGRWE